ncbi:conjugative transposon protein TraM [Bacteroides salyersiae]|nr:conjugative transposon protein TraM [Bacteroides salyersiae]MCS3059602.1 conjugative transposon protein TraM [Bacteroides salyersiae]
MEEVQKNENGTTVPQTDGKPEKEKKPKRELTPQQVQQRRKMIVFPLMFLAFAGCMYLIFAPSGKEDVNVESVGGFNADIPLPAEDGIIADKQKAYEQAMMNRKQQDKIQSLQDFGFTGNDEPEEPQAEIELMPEEDAQPKRGGGASSSANAYRDINRQLSTFYETPAVDEEKEDLKRQVAELTDRLQQQQNATPTTDDQMALLEKSYELAARYMNDGGQVAQVPVTGGIERKPDAVAVQALRETTVSGLQQPMSDADFIRAYSQPRNYGFNTAVGTGYAMGKNTVAACIHQDQTLTDGQAVKLRLLEPMQAGNIVVPKNTLVAGTAKVQGERLDILVSSIEYAGNIIPVELAVFDTDGQKGLSVPSSMEQEAFNEAMANIGSGLGTSISFAQSAGQQVAMDVTRGLTARNVRLPRQKVPNRESEAESRVQGDALRQTTIII